MTLLDGRSEIRNRVVARVFKELGYIEQWGSGIGRMRAACLEWGLAEPRIREKGDFVDVEFYRPGFGGSEAEVVPDTAGYRRIVPDTLSDQEREVINYIYQHRKITTSEAEALLLVKSRRAREVLREMTEKGWLVKQGNARSTLYVRAHD